MKDRNGESVKVNDPRAARSWPRRGQRLMGRYIPAAERGWIDVGIIGAEQSRAEQSRAEQNRAEQSRAEQSRAEQSRAKQSRAGRRQYHLAHRALCESSAWAPCRSFRFHKTAFEGSRPERSCGSRPRGQPC